MKNWINPQLNCITFDKTQAETQETVCFLDYWTWQCEKGCYGDGEVDGKVCPDCGGQLIRKCLHFS